MSYQPNWRLKVVEVPITVTLDAYDAGDVVGGLLTSDEIPQMNGGGYISWVRLVDDATQAEAYKLHCFYGLPSTIADAAAWAPTEADILNRFTVIDIPAANYQTDGSAADSAYVTGKDEKAADYLLFPNLPNGRMYLYLVSVATPDYADANDLTLHLGLMLM